MNPNTQAQEIALRELAQFTKACGLVNVRDTSEFIDKSLLVKVTIDAKAGREPQNETKGFKPIGESTQSAPAVQAPRAKPAAPLPRPSIKAPAVGSSPAGAPAHKGAFPWERKPAQPAPAEIPADVATDNDNLPFFAV